MVRVFISHFGILSILLILSWFTAEVAAFASPCRIPLDVLALSLYVPQTKAV